MTWDKAIPFIYLGLAICLALFLTRAPELKNKRLWPFLGLIAVVVFVAAFNYIEDIYWRILMLMLLRPLFFVAGLFWNEVISHHLVGAMESTLYGSAPARMAEMRLDYKLARTYRDNGRPEVAVECIRAELKKREDDFEGLFLMAGIYARDLRDLPNASKTVKTILDAEAIASAQKDYARTEFEIWKKELGSEGAGTKGVVNLGDEPDRRGPKRSVVDDAKRLRADGKNREALKLIESQIRKDSEDYAALLLAATIQAEDLGNLAAAERLVERIREIPYLSRGYLDYAETQLRHWRNPPDSND